MRFIDRPGEVRMARGVKIRYVKATLCRFAQVVAFRIGHDPDDHKIQCPIRSGGPDPASNGIRPPKMGAGHRLIDYADERRIAFILWSNLTAGEDRNAHRREIAR